MKGAEFWVIGSSEVVLGFRTAGIRGRAAVTDDETRLAFDEAKAVGALVVVLTADVAQMARDWVDPLLLRGEFPLIVEVPSWEGAPKGGKSLVERIREAVGLAL